MLSMLKRFLLHHDVAKSNLTKFFLALENSWQKQWSIELYRKEAFLTPKGPLTSIFPGWRLRDIQRWSALIQKNFRSVSALFITWKSMNSADSALNSVENPKFQSSKWALIFFATALKLAIIRAKKSALNQQCFSADFLWKELIIAEAFWNSSYQSWFFLRQRWTSLNSVSSNPCPHRTFQLFSTET